MCWLARASGIAPEEFRRRLVNAGMKPSRASEIKVVLQVSYLRDRFIADREYSWAEVKKDARDKIQTDRGLGLMKRLAVQLVALMYRNGIASVTHAQGTFYLKQSHLPPLDHAK